MRPAPSAVLKALVHHPRAKAVSPSTFAGLGLTGAVSSLKSLDAFAGHLRRAWRLILWHLRGRLRPPAGAHKRVLQRGQRRCLSLLRTASRMTAETFDCGKLTLPVDIRRSLCATRRAHGPGAPSLTPYHYTALLPGRQQQAEHTEEERPSPLSAACGCRLCQLPHEPAASHTDRTGSRDSVHRTGTGQPGDCQVQTSIIMVDQPWRQPELPEKQQAYRNNADQQQ